MTAPRTGGRKTPLPMETIHGAPSFVLRTPEVELAVTRTAGHLAPVRFHLGPRDLDAAPGRRVDETVLEQAARGRLEATQAAEGVGEVALQDLGRVRS